jgi:hypothetical protein
LAPPDDPEHECGWQGYAKTLEKKLVEMEQRLAQLERHRSEKLPPLERERRRNRDSEEGLAEAKRKREERALAKTKLVTETVELNDVNPIAYLRDVLLRISTHPADRIDDLLPDRWNPAESA